MRQREYNIGVHDFIRLYTNWEESDREDTRGPLTYKTAMEGGVDETTDAISRFFLDFFLSSYMYLSSVLVLVEILILVLSQPCRSKKKLYRNIRRLLSWQMAAWSVSNKVNVCRRPHMVLQGPLGTLRDGDKWD